MIRIPTHRAPTHPGEMLEEEFLKPYGMTQSRLAELTGVPFQRINQIVNGKRGVTPDTALRLSRVFGTSPQFWLNMQNAWDMYHTLAESRGEIQRIRTLPQAARRARSFEGA